MRPGRLEEFLRVQHGRALHPRIERVGRNRVELLGRRLDEVPRVVDLHAHFGIADDVEVVLAEICGHHPWYERFDFGDRFVLHRRVDRHGAGGDPCPAADHDHVARVLRDERRQVAEHALQTHVLRLARRLHLAGVVIVQHAVRELRDGD